MDAGLHASLFLKARKFDRCMTSNGSGTALLPVQDFYVGTPRSGRSTLDIDVFRSCGDRAGEGSPRTSLTFEAIVKATHAD